MKASPAQRTLCLAGLLSGSLLLPASAFSQAKDSTPQSSMAPARGSVNKQADGTVVKSYDVVSYFQARRRRHISRVLGRCGRQAFPELKPGSAEAFR